MQKGFTLVELLVVVVIIGILSAVAVPNFAGAQDKAKNSGVQSSVHAVQLAIEQYSVDNNNMFADRLSNSVFVANTEYMVGDSYPKTPWGTQQAPASDITFTDLAVPKEQGAGTLAPPTAITHFGAISFRCTDGVAQRCRYDLAGTGKRGDKAIRVVNTKNY